MSGTSILVVAAFVSVMTAQRLDAQGVSVGSAITLPVFLGGVSEVSVAGGAGGWLVGATNFGNDPARVTLQWVDASGSLGASATLTHGLPNQVDRAPPALAWNGSEWLVALQSGACTITIERFSASLSSLGSTVVPSLRCQRSVAVTPSFDGGWFVANSEVDSPGSELHLHTFSSTLTAIDDEVIARGRDIRAPALTRIEPGTLGVAYVKLVDEAPFGTWRVRLQHWPASPAPVADAGAPDAGGNDAGLADAGSGLDAGVADAGVADAGVADAGVADAGVADAGVADAGVTDAGVADAGVADAGNQVGRDAGSVDAGVTTPLPPSGCGCASGEASLLLALGILVLRRRRPRCATLGPC